MSAAEPRDMRGAPPGGGRPEAGSGGDRRGGRGRLWLWWVCGVVGVVALTILAQLLWSGLSLYVTVRVPVVVGTAGAVVLLIAALAVLIRIRRRAAVRRLRESVQAESRTRHRQFLQRLDHELKNPLTAVRAAVADASRTAGPAVAADLEVVDAQSRRMSRLLTDLRKLAELETAPLALEEVDLAETVQDAVSAVIEEAAGRGAAVRVRLDLPAVPWPLPHVRGDGDLLYSAVYNVIANAAKYTPEGGAVEVRGREEAGAVTIEVADTGIGVPEADLERVFHELERAGNAGGLPGSGLGLALVRTIVDRHGGRVRMASREGVGTRVWLTLPVAGPPRSVPLPPE
ncbi:sensor histidine kinase [Actinomyces procaprae]|uniref:sensor histidine kinase n=1 Tax=Actinomyces procaprae TaxID=2560010 RepID=UPI001F0248FA|nr:HAMP domain-containing sensor histidine kinase [Actinomyces procaprae]